MNHLGSAAVQVQRVGASSPLPPSVVHDVVGKRKEVQSEINMKRRKTKSTKMTLV
jgi:hypothetical protein